MRVLLDKATFYSRLLWWLRSQKDLFITMVALFSANYLNGISCLHNLYIFYLYIVFYLYYYLYWRNTYMYIQEPITWSMQLPY